VRKIKIMGDKMRKNDKRGDDWRRLEGGQTSEEA
jgi:hypothetical protein